jgi:hypothetical protein
MLMKMRVEHKEEKASPESPKGGHPPFELFLVSYFVSFPREIVRKSSSKRRLRVPFPHPYLSISFQASPSPDSLADISCSPRARFLRGRDSESVRILLGDMSLKSPVSGSPPLKSWSRAQCQR